MLGKAICGAGIDGETEESSRNSSDDRPAENNKRGIIRSSPNDASPTSPNKYIKIELQFCSQTTMRTFIYIYIYIKHI